MNELARSLKEGDIALQPETISSKRVFGVNVYLLLHDITKGIDKYNLPLDINQSLQAELDLMNEAALPDGVEAMLKEIDANRVALGSPWPVDITSTMHFVSLTDRAKEVGLGEPGRLLGGYPDFRNLDKCRNMLAAVVNDPQLRTEFVRISSIRQPDDMNDYLVDSDDVAAKINKLNVQSGTVLELGTGTGRSAVELKEKLPETMTVIAMERQYHAKWYDPHWKAGTPGITFISGDFVKGIPLPDESVDVVVMKYVINYLTEEALAAALENVTIVLKVDGCLLVGPQSDELSLRALQKSSDGQLVEVVPDTKTKP